MGRAFPEAGRYIAVERSTGSRWRPLSSRVIHSEVVVYDQDASSDVEPLGTVVQRFPSFGVAGRALEDHGWHVEYGTPQTRRRWLSADLWLVAVRPVGAITAT